MYPEDVAGRVPTTAIERGQLAAERAMWRQDNQPPAEHDPEADRLLTEYLYILAKNCAWRVRINAAICDHGYWFYELAYMMFDRIDGKWQFHIAKSAEPTIMDVPDPDGATCYITERLEPIEYKEEGTDPDAVGQAAIEFIRQIQLPVQNVPMPMEREVHDRVHGGQDLVCRCKLSYGIAVRDFMRFSEHGPWLPRRKETQLLGYPMSQ